MFQIVHHTWYSSRSHFFAIFSSGDNLFVAHRCSLRLTVRLSCWVMALCVMVTVVEPAWLGHVAIAQPRTLTIEELLSEGKKLFDAHTYPQAIPFLQAIVNRVPQHREARKLLAFALARNGQEAEAIVQARQTLALGPPDTRLQMLLAGLLSKQPNSRNEAIQLYRGVLKREPDHPVAQLGLAEVYRLAGYSGAAIPLFQQLIEAQPEEPFYHLRLAQAYGALGALDKARAEFERAHEQHPEDLDALRSLAILADIEDRLEEAIQLYQQVLERQPEDVSAHLGIIELEGRLHMPRVHRPVREIQRITLKTYLTRLDVSNLTLQKRLKVIDTVETRSHLRFLPSFFVSPSSGEIGSTSTSNLGFSFGWNLSELLIDGSTIQKQGMEADYAAVRRALADEVARLYFARQDVIARYQQLQRSLALNPANAQMRQQKQSVTNNLVGLSERLNLLTGLK